MKDARKLTRVGGGKKEVEINRGNLGCEREKDGVWENRLRSNFKGHGLGQFT